VNIKRRSWLGSSLIAVVFVLGATCAHAQTFVNEAHNDSSGAATTVATSITITAGHTAVVVVALDKDTPAVTGVVDNGSGSSAYTSQVVVAGVAGISTGFEIWTSLAVGTGVTSVTVTVSSATRFAVSVFDVSGVSAIGTHASTSATGTTAQSPGTLGTMAFVVGGFSQTDQGTAGSAVTGTLRANDFMNNQGNVAITSMYNAGTSISFTFPGSAAWTGGLVGLSAAGGAKNCTLSLLGVGPCN
jgi:hypothetical protein